jgi:DNA modification methylase
MSWGKALVAMEIAMSYIGKGEAVWDPCAGSGTSLIAAEKHGRIWRGAELQTKWADLILKRWEEQTGKTAECEGPGTGG